MQRLRKRLLECVIRHICERLWTLDDEQFNRFADAIIQEYNQPRRKNCWHYTGNDVRPEERDTQ